MTKNAEDVLGKEKFSFTTFYTKGWRFSARLLNCNNYCICICFDGVVVTAQCTVIFSDLLCSPEFRYY